MAARYSKGSRAQAVDELGRWCNAKVGEVNGDGLWVSFPGYPEHDQFVSDERNIRSPVLPYEQQQRRK